MTTITIGRQTKVTEGFSSYALNRQANYAEHSYIDFNGKEVQLYTITVFKAPISKGKQFWSKTYKTAKGAQTAFAKEIAYYYEPVTEITKE